MKGNRLRFLNQKPLPNRKEERKMKKFLIVLAAAVVLMTGCAKKEAKASGTLVVWSFTDELKTMIDK